MSVIPPAGDGGPPETPPNWPAPWVFAVAGVAALVVLGAIVLVLTGSSDDQAAPTTTTVQATTTSVSTTLAPTTTTATTTTTLAANPVLSLSGARPRQPDAAGPGRGRLVGAEDPRYLSVGASFLNGGPTCWHVRRR